jgi:hypothetical protein
MSHSEEGQSRGPGRKQVVGGWRILLDEGLQGDQSEEDEIGEACGTLCRYYAYKVWVGERERNIPFRGLGY